MVRQTRNIPQGKENFVSEDEKQQAYDYQHVTDNEYHAGINVGQEGYYDPEAGATKHPILRPESEPTPVLATDPGQPSGITANLVSRDSNPAVDKTESPVVRSTGRKQKLTEESTDVEGTGKSS